MVVAMVMMVIMIGKAQVLWQRSYAMGNGDSAKYTQYNGGGVALRFPTGAYLTTYNFFISQGFAMQIADFRQIQDSLFLVIATANRMPGKLAIVNRQAEIKSVRILTFPDARISEQKIATDVAGEKIVVYAGRANTGEDQCPGIFILSTKSGELSFFPTDGNYPSAIKMTQVSCGMFKITHRNGGSTSFLVKKKFNKEVEVEFLTLR